MFFNNSFLNEFLNLFSVIGSSYYKVTTLKSKKKTVWVTLS